MIQDISTLVLIVLLATWFALSVLGQIGVRNPSSRFQRIRRWDWFGLIPIWTFFAPRPSWTDYHLLYRDRLMDGNLTPWTEVVLIEQRRWWHIVWNPGKHERKALIDFVRTFTREVGRLKNKIVQTDLELSGCTAAQLPASIFMSSPYIALLHVVCHLPRLSKAHSTQFLIMKMDAVDSGDPSALILSAFHEL
jgi:hypothetical protein